MSTFKTILIQESGVRALKISDDESVSIIADAAATDDAIVTQHVVELVSFGPEAVYSTDGSLWVEHGRSLVLSTVRPIYQSDDSETKQVDGATTDAWLDPG